MVAGKKCDECNRLQAILESATLSYYRIQSQLVIARSSRGPVPVAQIVAELQEFAAMRSGARAELRRHQNQMHSGNGVPAGPAPVAQHICDETCRSKSNLDRAAAALEQSSASLSASIFSGPDDLIERCYARVLDAVNRLSAAATSYKIHLGDPASEN